MKQERLTPQLAAVYRAVDAARDHPTAHAVFARVRDDLPRVSLGTVYRNLEKLARQGRLRVLRLDSGARHYDAVCDPHDHFICEDCGVVVDVVAGITQSVDAAPRLLPHLVRRRSTLLYGSCMECTERTANAREAR